MDSFPLYYFSVVTAYIAQEVHQKVPLPFIDERFHLAQCATYCAGRFSEWDDKITTPPGLYLLGTAYSRLLLVFGVQESCGTTALRSLNLLGGAAVLPLVLLFLKTGNFTKLNVVSLPLLYTYYFLFYTDVWSTIFVVAGIVTVIRQPNFKGAVLCNLLGFMGLWFRQTNILWILFCAVVLIEQRAKRYRSFSEQVTEFLRLTFKSYLTLAPFVVNAALFAAFVKVNGGITFGDKQNHQMSLHLVQIFYCWSFVGGLTMPLWLNQKTLRDYRRYVLGAHGAHLPISVLSYYIIYYIVQNFTVVHPFLLADNRHYTFYIYRRILSKPAAKYFVVPVYHFFTWLIPYLLGRTPFQSRVRLSSVGTLAFLGASVLTLIPSPLFEPRYYIVPLVLFRIFCRSQLTSSTTKNHLYEFLWYLFINALVFIVFFNYEFTWLSEPGIQRIIW